MKNGSFYVIITFYLALFLIILPFSAGQDAYGTEQIEPLQIKLSVNEIRIDVAVLDKKGNPITNLDADDFEVFQDNKRQKILSCVYIDSRPDATVPHSAVQNNVTNLKLLPTATLKKEDVRRTILFIIDDYSMSFENGYFTKMALRNFVEKQMLPGDLVAIMRTNYGNSALNIFYSDKREVFARINAMTATMSPRTDLELNLELDLDSSETLAQKKSRLMYYTNFLTTSHEKQISTISYSLRVLKDMPGRKTLIMMAPFFALYSDLKEFHIDSYTRLADDALRAGVVVNLLNIDGLNRKVIRNNSQKAAGDYIITGADASLPNPHRSLEDTLAYLATQRELQDEIIKLGFQNDVFNPMPAQTGGITIRDSNFYLDGIGREVENLMRGYYLISYEPPPNTFEARNKKDAFRRLKVNIKRKDAVVHTRSGFFGKLESEMDVGITKQQPLVAAIMSPFQSTDVNVNIAAGYIKDAKAGYLVRSWIHIEPKDLKIIETEDGGARLNIETLCVTSDINGVVQDSKSAEFSLNIKHDNKSENLAWIQSHGIRFSMLLPVKKPGHYYVQVAIQDTETGKVGSAYQFLEVPDLGKKGLELSNIFMITSDEDLNWMRSDVTKEIAGGVFLPVLQGDVRSPAFRTFIPGDNLHIFATLYNADMKMVSDSEIEVQSVLYKDGVEFLRGNSVPLTPDDVERLDNSIPIMRRYTVGSDMPPGDYVLQLMVTNKKNSKKQEGNASQFLSFTVIE